MPLISALWREAEADRIFENFEVSLVYIGSPRAAPGLYRTPPLFFLAREKKDRREGQCQATDKTSAKKVMVMKEVLPSQTAENHSKSVSQITTTCQCY